MNWNVLYDTISKLMVITFENTAFATISSGIKQFFPTPIQVFQSSSDHLQKEEQQTLYVVK